MGNGNEEKVKYVNNIIKSPEDKRLYKALELSNKLKVLLISDPDTDKSAASLDVCVGRFVRLSNAEFVFLNKTCLFYCKVHLVIQMTCQGWRIFVSTCFSSVLKNTLAKMNTTNIYQNMVAEAMQLHPQNTQHIILMLCLNILKVLWTGK